MLLHDPNRDDICDYEIPSTALVSRSWIRVLTNAISFLVFSIITIGSLYGQRRKLGAKTMLRLLASILVTVATSGRANSCRKRMRKERTVRCMSGRRDTSETAAAESSPTRTASA